MDANIIAQTSQIVSADVFKDSAQVSDLPVLISKIYQSLKSAVQPQVATEAPTDLKPAVPIKKSITVDYIICHEDGKKS